MDDTSTKQIRFIVNQYEKVRGACLILPIFAPTVMNIQFPPVTDEILAYIGGEVYVRKTIEQGGSALAKSSFLYIPKPKTNGPALIFCNDIQQLMLKTILYNALNFAWNECKQINIALPLFRTGFGPYLESESAVAISTVDTISMFCQMHREATIHIVLISNTQVANGFTYRYLKSCANAAEEFPIV